MRQQILQSTARGTSAASRTSILGSLQTARSSLSPCRKICGSGFRTSKTAFQLSRNWTRWLVKPTDGIFARLNRRVSIPISRQIIRFPITPNMVSLFTLGVSFSSGVFYARGGYWNMLLGASLSLFASILDGSDGEVARLKLQESAFGCWLETVCDYLYYLFIFGGMTIGLLRSSGMRVYIVWGGLLFFGAVLSFLVTGLQRHRLATDRPEQ